MINNNRFVGLIIKCLNKNLINAKKLSTIYSLSSGLNNVNTNNQRTVGVAIAVIRISGPQTSHVINSITNGQFHKFKPRLAKLTNLYNTENDLIDKAIAIYFAKPTSYTGEDLCELHVHGSKAVIQSVLQTLSKFDHTSPAENGEFTKRAFLNQKLSLIEAEAINDLIESNCDSQRRNALKGLTGNVVRLYDNWRRELIKLHVHIQADIEFGEDQLLDEERIDRTIQDIFKIKDEIKNFLKISSKRRQIVKEGLNLCILGSPNVGKSSLMNTLCDKELSIVSPFQGTTRDVIEYSMEINGFKVNLSDTAGIRDLHDSNENYVENLGIRRALERAKTADVLVHLIDVSKLDVQNELLGTNYTLYLNEKLNNFFADKKVVASANIIHVLNKIDLIDSQLRAKLSDLFRHQSNVIQLSCMTKENLVDLIQLIGQNIEKSIKSDEQQQQDEFVTERHENHLRKIVDYISSAIDTINEDRSISAYYIENAINQIACITGSITTEHILDELFSSFCIGK